MRTTVGFEKKKEIPYIQIQDKKYVEVVVLVIYTQQVVAASVK